MLPCFHHQKRPSMPSNHPKYRPSISNYHFRGEVFVYLRYSTFNFVYKERWRDILRFREKNLFTQCEVCQTLKADLADKTLSFDQKLGSLQTYRNHLYDQFCDRTICWRLQAESADPSTDVVTICTDGLDQSKFSLPRDPQLKASAALNLSRLK